MRVSPLTIRRRIDDGQIQAVKFGRLWRITMAEVRRLLQGPGSGAMT
jgi:excisionase family DNA binding protein